MVFMRPIKSQIVEEGETDIHQLEAPMLEASSMQCKTKGERHMLIVHHL